MKLIMKKFTKKLATGGGFDEAMLRKSLREKDHDSVVAQFLGILHELDLALDLVGKLRGGDAELVQKCTPGCGRWKIWVGEGKNKQWVCPNCLWEQLRENERAKTDG